MYRAKGFFSLSLHWIDIYLKNLNFNTSIIRLSVCFLFSSVFQIFDLARERSDIEDVWETVGSPPESRFTWDMSQNDNLNMNGGKPRLRYDRVYLHQKTKSLSPVNFSLIGKERLACGMFASDHWGILTDFKVHQDSTSASRGTWTSAVSEKRKCYVS